MTGVRRDCLVLLLAGLGIGSATADEKADLAQKAQGVLKAHCYRCHGQDGAAEGGFNYILDLGKLVARKKIVPGNGEASPLLKRVVAGKMPPPEEKPRPSPAEVETLKAWIAAGAPMPAAGPARPVLTDADVNALILADLETLDRRSRRFMRYFSLVPLYNAGLGDDELQTYRLALSKVVNCLSWHPRIYVPKPIDPAKVLLRIDLRDSMWYANLWNRVLIEYPYGILHDTATTRAVAVATATRMPVVRADWFIATASRAPLYYDLLQMPTAAAELERLLRVDVLTNLQQDRAIRAGFNGSGISRNNRLIERHDAIHGALWKSYDFEEVPQNLVGERQGAIPDRRNLFAYPLGPGFTENTFQHAGGEMIFHLPNGLHGYMLVTADGRRLDKGPVNIVSDPKRPDRAVEAGLSCMNCHARGYIPKADQIRTHVEKNAAAFSKADQELIKSLYAPEAKMKGLMDEDNERFLKALEKAGIKPGGTEPTMLVTLRYEAEVDAATAAAEFGLSADDLATVLAKGRSDLIRRNLGALKPAGGTVQRQVFVEAFSEVVREARLGAVFQPLAGALTPLPDGTGEVDPLEAQGGAANHIAFSADGRRALIAGADKSVRLWEVEGNRELRRFIGHTASVWSVAFSPDGRRALSGGADNVVRLWDVETGRELRTFAAHTGLVSAVTFLPDGKRALSAGYDHTVFVWDLETGQEVRSWKGQLSYLNSVSVSADGRRVAVCGGKTAIILDVETSKELARLDGHTASVAHAIFSKDGRRVLTCSEDGTLRWWEADSGQEIRRFSGHKGAVKALALSADGRLALSGGADHTVRVWDLKTATELAQFKRHNEPILGVSFTPDGRQTVSGSKDSMVHIWNVPKLDGAKP